MDGPPTPPTIDGPSTHPGIVRILFCEGNTDGTIGGSYFSLLYLVEGLRGTRFRPVTAFFREHALLPRFAEAGADVRVMEKPAPFWLLSSDGSFRSRHPVLSGPVLLIQRALNLTRFVATVLRYARLLRREGIGLLHLNNSVTRSHDWMLAACLARVPCVVHERGINTRLPRPVFLLARRLSAVICISEAVKDSLLRMGLDRARLRVIYNGLDPARIAPGRSAERVRASYGIGPNRRVIALIGNIKEWKGQEVVVRALPAIVARVPDTLCLLVGATAKADLPYAENLHRLVAGLALEQHVRFAGHCENVADVLNVVEVAIHASIAPEPFGRVLLEAMAMRKPVVASRGGAIPEIVEHGVTGYTFSPGSSEELAERVIELLERPATAAAFGEAGWHRLSDRFGTTLNVARTTSLYDEILGTTA